MGSLFPCLPDEIGWECLLRVELNSHHNLRCVCKSWNAALKSPHFYRERKRLKISEQRICMLQDIVGVCSRVAVYDQEKNTCKNLPPIPTESNGFVHCHFVKQKLVLIKDCVADFGCVWLYDFVCSKWRQGAKMPRCQKGTVFACAVDEHGGLIYVGGGFYQEGIYLDGLRSASVYNVEEDKWDVLPDMNTSGSIGAFADGKFYVMDYDKFGVFDAYTRSWKTMENRFVSMLFVSGFERLHCFSIRELIAYDYSQDKLNIVGTFPIEDWGQLVNLGVVVSNKIFVRKCDPIQGQGFYMLEPPSESGGTVKLIGIDRPSGLQGFTISAATLDL
ncbi:hypothetical protein SUGI_0215640 [Cryptomeria japonica]|uniref:F-box/kelch-repeat protein At1g80440-like n=1 Tax=Cryptomeria japonica TaxID=3369 RepID=UPI002408A918|nr:F-box/kelch-repeat protein At1g80440-like [Cryptomeria japonica]GLJ13574.1 hypothetical protein SUGI_0215640 [Cryptomeria japonica]